MSLDILSNIYTPINLVNRAKYQTMYIVLDGKIYLISGKLIIKLTNMVTYF